MRNAGSITVVLGLRAVADDKYLHVLKQSASGPETFPVVAPYLVKGLFYVHSSAFQLHVYQWQSVHQDSHVVTVLVAATFGHILVDNLQVVIVYVLFVEQINVLGGTVLTGQQLDVIILHDGCFLHDTTVLVAIFSLKKAVHSLSVKR